MLIFVTRGPMARWQYWNGSAWRNERTLKLEFTSLSPCQLVRVEGATNVRKLSAGELADFKIQQQKRWSNGGIAVYQLSNSTLTERNLLVNKGQTTWTIDDSASGEAIWIFSGRATTEAAASGMDRWRYINATDAWKQGDITVRCLD